MQTPPSHPNAAPTTKHHPAPSSPPHSVYPSKLSLRDMKSLAKATKVTATTDGAKFIILGTNTSKKKRRRKAKAAPVVSAEELLKKQREDRRRAAHDRLLARQAKIALKKQQDQAKKAAAAVAAAASEPANDDSSESDNDVNDVAPSSSDEEYVDADGAAPAHKEIEAAGHPCADVPDAGKPAVDPAVDGDERIRRINAQLCLVQAEDNLRALRSCTPRTATHVPTQEAAASPLQPEPNVALDLRCQPETHERVPEAPDTSSQPRPHEIHEADVTHREPEAAAGSTPDDSSDDASDGGGGDDDVMASPPCETAYDRSSFHTTVYLVMKGTATSCQGGSCGAVDESPTAAPPTASLPEWFQDQRNLISHITDEPSDATKPDRLEGGANGTRFTCSDAPAIPGDTTAATDASAADRARTIMSNLMRDRSCIQSCQASVDCALESLSTPSACPVATEAHTTRGANKSQRPRSCHRASGPHLPLAKGQSADSARPQRPSRHQSAKGPPTAPVVMPLVKMPSKPVTDYSSIYRNFYCTMTSFYERMKAAQEHSGKTHTKDIIQNGDVAIRFQLKLYTVWTNIMHDYATVFGVHGMRLTACWSTSLTDRRAPQDVAPDRLIMKAAFDIAPETFILPHDYIPFVQAFKRRADAVGATHNFWIMKPVALSRGRGISLLNDLGQVAYGDAVVVQKYIENPLLLDGFKAFFYNEGFVRICTHRYSTDSADLGNLFMHLTNSSIQKHGHMDQVAYVARRCHAAVRHVWRSENPVHHADATEAGGTKASLAYLWSRLAAANAPVDAIKAAIVDVIVKSLVAGEDSIPYQVNSFDLYGYDILLDDQYRPWLIEINSSPSMARENHLDYVIKDALLYDTMRVVNPLHFDRAALVSVLQRRADELAHDKKRPNLMHPMEAEARAMRQLNEDLTDILRGHVPRQHGEMPEHMGNFQRIAPSAIHTQRSCFRENPPPAATKK
ncbi:hypothetical protein DYB32_000994 [Aphanomyces invadans]|uniref:Tubulin-tyrosine ligase family protein n=1 Tax=Aphanomyces invadans TaxID=157072 RepID=A0A418B849_9STRA|nr:hypothetical protein DYB32_000994 [Aphanomyces invadans]